MKYHDLTLLYIILYAVITTSYCASDDLLYFYGEPFFTSTTGFVKIDPKDLSWKSTARGFATDYLHYNTGIKGLQFDYSSTNIVTYGYFQFWNNTFVGGVLHIDPLTLDVSTWGKGVLGKQVNTGTFLSETEFVLAGLFTGFTQQPSTQLHAVGICDQNGENCFNIGQQIPGMKSPISIIASGRQLFLFYYIMSSATGGVVSMYDYSDGDRTKAWEISLNVGPDCTAATCFLVLYKGTPWFFGGKDATNQSVTYEYSNGTWLSHPIDFSYAYNPSLTPFISASPDGQSIYLEIMDSWDLDYYKWSDEQLNWIPFINTNCYSASSTWDAFNNGIILGCNETIIKVTDTVNGPVMEYYPNSNCSQGYFLIEVAPSNEFFLVLSPIDINSKDNDQLEMKTFKLGDSTEVLKCCNNITRLESLFLSPQGMCIYGDKIFFTGGFEEVDDVKMTDKMALWDESKNSWFSVSINPNDTASNCYCDTDGYKLVALCQMSHGSPVLLMDFADNDGIEKIDFFVLDEIGNNTYSSSLVMDGDIIYFMASSKSRSNMTLYYWTQKTGAVYLSAVRGSGTADIEIANNLLFFAGSYSMNSTNTRLLEYYLDNNTWTQPSLLWQTSTNKTGTAYAVDYCQNGLMYVGGDFTLAGSLHALNVAGYDLNGTAVDSLGSGLPNGVPKLVCMENQLYMVYFQEGCPQQIYPYCGMLVYYDLDTKLYSYPIALGAATIAKGADISQNNPKSTNDNGLSQTGKALIITFVVVAVLAAVVAGFFLIRKWAKDYSRRFYQEINDAINSTSIDADDINFETERFEIKNVLGKGSFGTVWSCVLPDRGAATFAVKQILLSKGDTERIQAVQNEIELLKKLRHPNIVHFVGSKMETAASSIEFFLFMELYDKPCSLKGVIMKKLDKAEKQNFIEWFTFNEVRKFLRQISDGLHYLHEQGIAHRDLKSANILVRTEGNSTNIKSLHIADFGISKSMETGSKMASTIVGTSGFMAPEILRQEKYDAFKADIWAFGIVIFEILTWQEPLTPGLRPQFPETHPLAHYNKQFQKVIELFMECTEDNPQQRPTCEELFHQCSTL